MITETELEALGFNKIVWNLIVPEYWLPLGKPKDDYRDMDFRLGVRFNEFKNDPGPRVWLVIGSAAYLPHIKETDQVVQLYELLSGRSLTHAGADLATAPPMCPFCGFRHWSQDNCTFLKPQGGSA